MSLSPLTWHGSYCRRAHGYCCRCLGSAALAAALRCCRLRQQVASHLTLRDAGTRLRRAAARCRSC